MSGIRTVLGFVGFVEISRMQTQDASFNKVFVVEKLTNYALWDLLCLTIKLIVFSSVQCMDSHKQRREHSVQKNK